MSIRPALRMRFPALLSCFKDSSPDEPTRQQLHHRACFDRCCLRAWVGGFVYSCRRLAVSPSRPFVPRLERPADPRSELRGRQLLDGSARCRWSVVAVDCERTRGYPHRPLAHGACACVGLLVTGCAYLSLYAHANRSRDDRGGGAFAWEMPREPPCRRSVAMALDRDGSGSGFRADVLEFLRPCDVPGAIDPERDLRAVQRQLRCRKGAACRVAAVGGRDCVALDCRPNAAKQTVDCNFRAIFRYGCGEFALLRSAATTTPWSWIRDRSSHPECDQSDHPIGGRCVSWQGPLANAGRLRPPNLEQFLVRVSGGNDCSRAVLCGCNRRREEADRCSTGPPPPHVGGYTIHNPLRSSRSHHRNRFDRDLQPSLAPVHLRIDPYRSNRTGRALFHRR